MSRLMQIPKSVAASLGDVITGRPDVVPEPSPRLSSLAGVDPGGIGIFDAWFGNVRVPQQRVEECRFYDNLEREIADVRKALDAYATMAVTGSLAGGGQQTYSIRLLDDEDKYPAELRDRLRAMEKLIRTNAYHTVRTMVKYGSYMPEIIPGRMDDGRLGIKSLKPIPPGTIFRNIGPNGAVDPDHFWQQIINNVVVMGGLPQSAPVLAPVNGITQTKIPQWRLPHFAMWTNVVSATETLLYGTSILQPFGAIGLKLHAMLDAAVVARLSRAAMRYVWSIDISDILKDQDAIRKRVVEWKTRLSRQESLFNPGSRQDSFQRAPVPDSDLFVPAAENMKWGVDKIDGDQNLARVGDIELAARFYFGALGVPPEYLGHERSQGGRSNLSQVDINFARSTRHIQLFAASGFEHVVFVDMILGGWDPRKYPIAVVPPQIGARDDLLQSQIRTLQAGVVKALRDAGMRIELAPRWVFNTFLGLHEELEDLDPDILEKIFADLEDVTKPANANPDASTESIIRRVVNEQDPQLVPEVKAAIRLFARSAPGDAYGHHERPSPGDLSEQIGRAKSTRAA